MQLHGAISYHDQLFVHIKASNFVGWSLPWWGLISRLRVLKPDSDVTAVVGMKNILGNQHNVGNFS